LLWLGGTEQNRILLHFNYTARKAGLRKIRLERAFPA
jgi:hypothetical protein